MGCYPDYPDQRLIVGGVDLSEKFKMVLVDGYALSPPKPKTYKVNIPGGNGQLDLTEALMGDVVYEDRSQKFTFCLINVDDFEKAKTEISGFLHGKEFDYQLTFDPGYTYHGRFTIESYTHDVYSNGVVGVIEVSVEANPYKYLPDKIVRIDAIGGAIITLQSGRKHVVPTIETDGFLKVIFNNKLHTIPQGTWKINDLILKEGTNEIYFNSYDVHNLEWGDLITNQITWAGFKEKRLFEWYKTLKDGGFAIAIWEQYADKTWADVADTTWSEIRYTTETSWLVKDVYAKYEWGDL